MECLGILRARSIEIVDVTFRDGEIAAKHCPGGLPAPCTQCPHARLMGAAAAPEPVLKQRRSRTKASLIICLWHEQHAPA